MHLSKLLLISLFSLLHSVNACFRTSTTTTTPKPVCCPGLTSSSYPRVKPPDGTTPYGYNQCAILNYYNNGPCPSSGTLVCQVAPYTSDTTAWIQLISTSGGTTTVIYQTYGGDSVDVYITCNSNGQWVYNGQVFNQVSCSQN